MPIQPTYPGVYVNELPVAGHAIVDAATSVTGFVGYLPSGPINTPVQLFSFADFLRAFGGQIDASETSLQIYYYFLNGGAQAWVSRVAAGSPTKPPKGLDLAGSSTSRTGFFALDAVSAVNILCAPDLRSMDASDYLVGATAMLNYAVQRRAFAILDPPRSIASVAEAAAWVSNVAPGFGPGLINGAAYFPSLEIPDPKGASSRTIGSSGAMAGLYATTDLNVGVWKAPAGVSAVLSGVERLSYVMNDEENGVLNPLGMNALRTFPIYGTIAWGARTLASANVADQDWEYLNVRRLALYIEQSLVQGLSWVVFEPNSEALWAEICRCVTAFLNPLYQQGAFFGATSDQAYQVVCDASTTSAEDILNGIVNIQVLFAPVRPAEFIVVSVQQRAGQGG